MFSFFLFFPLTPHLPPTSRESHLSEKFVVAGPSGWDLSIQRDGIICAIALGMRTKWSVRFPDVCITTNKEGAPFYTWSNDVHLHSLTLVLLLLPVLLLLLLPPSSSLIPLFPLLSLINLSILLPLSLG
jgi:hypothetical protein